MFDVQYFSITPTIFHRPSFHVSHVNATHPTSAITSQGNLVLYGNLRSFGATEPEKMGGICQDDPASLVGLFGNFSGAFAVKLREGKTSEFHSKNI